MPSLRQKLSKVRRRTIQQVTILESPLQVQNLELEQRDAFTGNWISTSANGSNFEVTKRGANSGYGLNLPGLTVKQGLGRFAN